MNIFVLTNHLSTLFQKEFNAGKQFVNNFNIDSDLNIQSNNLMFDNSENDKNSLNSNRSQRLSSLKLFNTFNNMDGASTEQNNELKIKKYLNQTKQMMGLSVKKQSKSQGMNYNSYNFFIRHLLLIVCFTICVLEF